MPTQTILFSLVLASIATAADAQTCPAMDANRAADEVRAAFTTWDAAVLHKDIEKTMAIFSPSVRFQFQGAADFGYAHLLSIYKYNFARENAPVWRPNVEAVIGSADMVSLFGEWKLMPAGGGDAIADYRGVDIFQRDAGCTWRVVASINYSDKPTLALNPPGQRMSPAQVSTDPAAPSTNAPLVANARVDR
jgi:ketosteroid isomerase-like protein